MSARIYRLLRNNKEEGPFTSEELLQKKLRPYDLIWIDGRSAAWSYPGELAEFKSYAPLPGENPANQVSQQRSTPVVSHSVEAAMAVNNSLAQPEIIPKPRYKVSAAWSKIQTVTAPVQKKVMVDETHQSSSKKIVESMHPESLHAKSLSWEDAWLDWEKEKTTAPVDESPRAKNDVNDSPETPGKHNTPVLETKYAESLDSLKDKYIENILLQKKRSNKNFSSGKVSEFILPTVALLIIFSVGYWLLHKTDVPTRVTANVPVKSTQPVVTPNENQPVSNTKDSSMASTTSAPAEDEKQNTNTALGSAPVTKHAEDRKNTVKPAMNKQINRTDVQSKFPDATTTSSVSKPATPITIDKSTKKADVPVLNNNINNNIGKERVTADNGDVHTEYNKSDAKGVAGDQPLEKEKPVIKNNKAKSGSDYVRVPPYIEMTNGLASLNIQNTSDINLDLVVIDVQYYDPYNRFRKGETIYLHHLKAGRNVIVKMPKDINSLYALSKISLVSSDAENVYIVGDN